MKQWKELFQQEEQKEYYRKLMQFLDEEYAHRTIYPQGRIYSPASQAAPLKQ